MKLNLSEQIQLIRKEQGYTQDTVASLANVTRATVCKIEKSAYSCNIRILQKVGRVLGLDIQLIGVDIK